MGRVKNQKPKRLTLSDLTIVRRHYDPHMDKYLVLGTAANDNHHPHYIVAWHSRHHKTLVDCHYFTGRKTAASYYKKIRHEDHETEHKSLKKDWQKRAVYDWEDDFLIPHARKLNQEQARALIRKVCRDRGIKTPRMVWKKANTGSEYDIDENVIYFGHRDEISLLHELTHAFYALEVDDNLVTDHSPGFIHRAIELYSAYTDISLGYMLNTAHKRGLLGDLEADQILRTKTMSFKREKKDARKKRAPDFAP